VEVQVLDGAPHCEWLKGVFETRQRRHS
jgi:hypothetical protein